MPRSSPLQPSPLAARPDEPGWPHEIYRALKAADIRQVSYVPDAGHRSLIELAHADPAIETTVLTTEEEGIALAAGAWLGGQRAVLLMQSSGVGNCINMLSLIAACRFPLLTLVTMRGEWGEFNPWQVPMGQATPEALAIMGVQVHRVDSAEEAAPTVAAAAAMAFDGDQAVAVLLSQRLLGRKTWVAGEEK
jgi:sulfopyruvate decarboxylase alpha subunit